MLDRPLCFSSKFCSTSMLICVTLSELHRQGIRVVCVCSTTDLYRIAGIFRGVIFS